MAMIVQMIWLAAEQTGVPSNDQQYKRFSLPGGSCKYSNKTHNNNNNNNNSCI